MRKAIAFLAILSVVILAALSGGGFFDDTKAEAATGVNVPTSIDPGGGGNSYCWPGIFGVTAYFNDYGGLQGRFVCWYATNNLQRFVNFPGYGWVLTTFGVYLPWGTPAWFKY